MTPVRFPGPVTKTWLVRSRRQQWTCCGGHSSPRGWLLQVHYAVPGGEGGQWFFSRRKRELVRLRALMFDGRPVDG